jgi:phasin family protein
MATNSNAATDAASKIDAAAEKAYAEAAANAEVAPKADAPKKAAKKVAKKPAKKTAKKVAATKPAAKKAVAKKAKIKSPKKTTTKKSKKSAAAAKPAKKLKDTIMAKAKDTNITDTAKSMAADAQTRVKTAAAKAGEFAGEVNEFNKGNIEAVVESGKILFAGAQEMSRENIATGKTVLETVTGDVKKMAGVKSPTELVQLQGELARRNLDAAISFGSKSTESWLKIYNDAFAPISSRVSVAAERIKKAA